MSANPTTEELRARASELKMLLSIIHVPNPQPTFEDLGRWLERYWQTCAWALDAATRAIEVEGSLVKQAETIAGLRAELAAAREEIVRRAAENAAVHDASRATDRRLGAVAALTIECAKADAEKFAKLIHERDAALERVEAVERERDRLLSLVEECDEARARLHVEVTELRERARRVEGALQWIAYEVSEAKEPGGVPNWPTIADGIAERAAAALGAGGEEEE